MKVALVYWGCHRRGGVERLVFEAARFLASHDHDVHVFTHEWEEIELYGKGRPVTFHRVALIERPRLLRSLSFFANSTQMVNRHSFDVLNSHGVFCPIGGVHWANSVHRAWLEKSKQFRAGLSLKGIRQKFNPQHQLILMQEHRHFQNGYQRIIAASTQVGHDLNHYYKTPLTDIQVINNGFDPTDFHPERRIQRRASERQRLSIAENEIVMLMAANELERKGLPTLLTAMQKLHRSDIKLIVAGRAAYQDYLPRIAAMGLEKQVMFVGSSKDIAAFHAAADFFVLPTQYEAFCLAIVEALGSGLPVLTTTVPGAGDTIQHGINGLLLQNPLDAHELADHITTLSDAATRQAMQDAAFPSIEPYQWSNILERYEHLLEQCKNF